MLPSVLGSGREAMLCLQGCTADWQVDGAWCEPGLELPEEEEEEQGQEEGGMSKRVKGRRLRSDQGFALLFKR